MINLLSLVKDTTAYKTVTCDKSEGRLSHAYLIITEDKAFLDKYVKIFAKLIMCDGAEICNTCRDCRLIEADTHPDVLIYPKKENIVTEDVANIIEESYLKPIEKNKKLFLLLNAQAMNAPAQNKLLKTLEEPPKNVHIILGATNEYGLLPTIKSRVKKLSLPLFSEEKIYSVLSSEYGETPALKNAVACCGGTLGKAIELYNDESHLECLNLVKDIIVNMQSSKDVLGFYNKIISSKIDIDRLISTLALCYRDFMMKLSGDEKLIFNKEFFAQIENAKGYTLGSVVYILEKLNEANKRKIFNNNSTMLIEWILFSILEGKHKWQKL